MDLNPTVLYTHTCVWCRAVLTLSVWSLIDDLRHHVANHGMGLQEYIYWVIGGVGRDLVINRVDEGMGEITDEDEI